MNKLQKIHNKKKITKVDKFDTIKKRSTVFDKIDSNKKKSILLKIYLKNGEIRKHTSRTYTRRISSIISHTNFKKAYIKVSYGKKICNYGCVCNFYNDGFYDNKEDLLYMLKVFWREE